MCKELSISKIKISIIKLFLNNFIKKKILVNLYQKSVNLEIHFVISLSFIDPN